MISNKESASSHNKFKGLKKMEIPACNHIPAEARALGLNHLRHSDTGPE